ncbi:hypothetical protein NC651_020464 [Populus alba x Populus x berolinensis]|nr:hypothetical protein NC651_020464 [Populus alba x Populus x berolinensis]
MHLTIIHGLEFISFLDGRANSASYISSEMPYFSVGGWTGYGGCGKRRDIHIISVMLKTPCYYIDGMLNSSTNCPQGTTPGFVLQNRSSRAREKQVLTHNRFNAGVQETDPVWTNFARNRRSWRKLDWLSSEGTTCLGQLFGNGTLSGLGSTNSALE